MNERAASLDSLPFEIIEHILNCDAISFTDVCRISCVSQLLNCIGKSNKLWQRKYTQTWPSLAALFDPHNTDWRSEFCFRYGKKFSISKKLQEMSIEFYHTENVSNDAFFEFTKVCSDHPLAIHILVEELDAIVNDSNRHVNLTHKYYAKRALRYLRHSILETTWQGYLKDNPQKLSLLKGACLITQWCQPTKLHCTTKVSYLMNEIVKLVFEQVTKTSPNHPVLKRKLALIENDDGTILDRSLWTSHECKVIFSAINEVMFNILRFCRQSNDFYSAENSFIDKVLSQRAGIPITLGIVYATVAAQLGVHCLPVNFPGHFLLKWLEHPHFHEDEAYTFIDVYHHGTLKTLRELEDLAPGYEHFTGVWIEGVSPVKVFARMCWNLVEVGRQRDGEGEGLLCYCNALELLSLLSPDDMEHKLLLARVYMHHRINMTRVISLLQEITEHDPVSTGIVGYMYRSAIATLESQRVKRQTHKMKQQNRSSAAGVEFAVGMIMKHKKYDYRCVIYGWSSVCTASKDWINQMGVYTLSKKDQQPFYLVLVEDGTNRYAAQENLEIHNGSEPIHHSEIGRYFQSFHGKYYLPNDQKMIEYPDDASVREHALGLVEN